MTRERDRYGRASLAEQLGNVIGWFRAHPLALLVVAILLGGVVVQVVAPQRSARPNDLAVGDCLFVPTSATHAVGPGGRPIGTPEDVTSVLMRGGAEITSCTASHGHEVSAIVDLPSRRVNPEVDRACREAFGTYVGGEADSSRYETFPAVPDTEQWDAGVHRVICLIARRDGQWMSEPARGSE